jgi:hypothetical protein
MRTRRTTLGLLATAIVGLALPAAASAEYLVPPGNSAATQYTEALPTAGGHSDAEKPNDKQSRAPSEVLGPRNARQLEDQGTAGREAAEFAAETAPADGVAPRQDTNGSDKSRGGQDEEEDGPGKDKEGGTVGAGNRGGGGPSGSSGLGEVAAQATGSSSGPLGLLLPLAIAGAVAWAFWFVLRQRNRPAA